MVRLSARVRVRDGVRIRFRDWVRVRGLELGFE